MEDGLTYNLTSEQSPCPDNVPSHEGKEQTGDCSSSLDSKNEAREIENRIRKQRGQKRVRATNPRAGV